MASRSPSLRVMLVEDSMLLREGVIRLLEEAGHQCVAARGDAEDIVEHVRQARPEVVVMDVRLPPDFRDEGIRAAVRLRRELPEVGVLVLSQYVETVYARELLAADAGGVGYLLKDRLTSLNDLDEALHRVADGGTVLDPEVVRRLVGAPRDPIAALTPREREVLELVAEGRSNVGIAEALTIGVGAVEKHVSGVFTKLGLNEAGEGHRRVLAVLAYLQR